MRKSENGCTLSPIGVFGGLSMYTCIHAFESGGGVPHSHSEARGARDIGYVQINGFPLQLAFFGKDILPVLGDAVKS